MRSHVVPGDPARLAAGPDANEAMVETLRAKYGLDQPLPVQFVHYLRGILSGDLGQSLRSRNAVWDEWWPGYVRLVPGKTLALKEETYVEAARAVGTGRLRIVFVHVLPNCVSPIVVKASMDMGTAILAAARLGFIGLGAQPPYPE